MWHGWIYSRGLWRVVCKAATVTACSAELDRLHPRPPSNLHVALTSGEAPRWNPAALRLRGRPQS